MKNSVNPYEPSVIQLEIPGLFEQLENSSNSNSKEKPKEKLIRRLKCVVQRFLQRLKRSHNH